MLERGWHQGAGLLDYSSRDDLRLLVVITQPGDTAGQHQMWQLCSGLQRAGQAVIVLDTTQEESVWTPGLAHLLDSAHLQPPSPEWSPQQATSIPVLPAAHGIEHLHAPSPYGAQALHPLQSILRGHRAVVLHGHTSLLAAPWLEQFPTQPLLFMPSTEAAMVECYRQLKVLSLYTNLTGLVVAAGHTESLRFRSRGLLNSLQRCARRHLGVQPRTYVLQDGSDLELQSLGLQLLENASTIGETHTAASFYSPWTGGAEPLAPPTLHH